MLKIKLPVCFFAAAGVAAVSLTCVPAPAQQVQRVPVFRPPPEGWPLSRVGYATLATARHVALAVEPARFSIRSGMSLVVQPTFVNHGHRPFTFVQGHPPGATFVVGAEHAGSGSPAPVTILGNVRAFNWQGPTVSPVVTTGHSLRFWTQMDLARYVDLSLPGKYRVVLTAGKIRSNAVVVTVLSPQAVPPSSPAIRKAPGAMAKWPTAGKGLQIYARPVASATVPEVRVYFRDSGRHSARVSLSGRPLSDLAAVEVTGPTEAGEVTLVRHLKPGQHGEPFTPPPYAPARLKGMRYAIPYQNRKPTRESLYGLWLSKHLPKGLKWKTYTLKPGVVYKYAEPINLSCMYDMSLSGIYRVRVELAHTHVWSPWANVTVP